MNEQQTDETQVPITVANQIAAYQEGSPVTSDGTENTATDQPTISFAAMDEAEIAAPKIKDGTYKFVLAEFRPQINQEGGFVEKWSLTLVAAQDIPDDQGTTIGTGNRVGQFSVWVSPSQYRTAESCRALVKRYIMALNGIVVDRKKDPLCKAAKLAFAALPDAQKRPCWVSINGGEVILDTDEELYSQWDGTVIQARIRTKAGAQFSDLLDIFAKDTPLAAPKAGPTKRG